MAVNVQDFRWCSICQLVFYNNDAVFDEHYRTHHKRFTHTCFVCRNKFPDANELGFHAEAGHHGILAFETVVRAYATRERLFDGVTPAQFYALFGRAIHPPVGIEWPPEPAEGYFFYMERHEIFEQQLREARIAKSKLRRLKVKIKKLFNSED